MYKKKKKISERIPPPYLQLKHLQRQRFVFWGSPGFFTIPFTTLMLPPGVTLCTGKEQCRLLPAPLTLYLACGGQMVDTWVLRSPVHSAKVSLAKEFEMLLSQSIMQVSTLLQAIPDPWMGQARHKASLLCGVAPLGYGTVKETALNCLREPIPELHCPSVRVGF